MFAEFKEFIAKGNVMELAVAVIIGAAFGTIVTSLTDDLIMPVVGALFGSTDFSDKYWVLSGTVDPGTSLAAARVAGANVLAWGSFMSTVINFLILAVIIFMLVRYTKKAMAEFEAKKPEEVAGPTEVELLTQIRDSLKK